MRNIDKFLHITMPDGSVYSVPVDYLWRVFAGKLVREVTYKDPFIIDHIKNEIEDDFPLFLDECIGNLDWEDVAPMAKLVSTSPKDFQEGWLNGDKELV